MELKDYFLVAALFLKFEMAALKYWMRDAPRCAKQDLKRCISIAKREISVLWRWTRSRVFRVRRKMTILGRWDAYDRAWFKYKLNKDEFDHSLNLDINKMMRMNKEEVQDYYDDIAKKRGIAHRLGIEKDKKKR